MVITAPDRLRAELAPMGLGELLAHCATRRPDPSSCDQPTVSTQIALRALARRHRELTVEIEDLDTPIAPLTEAINPVLAAMNDVGPDVPGQLLVTNGEHPHRLRSEAAFAMLYGAAHLPATSGRTRRHPLERGGDRQTNASLYRIVLGRLHWDPRTRAYAHRRGHEPKRNIRCLKRYIYRALLTPHDTAPAA